MTSSHSFAAFPKGAKQEPKKFELHIDEQKLQDFRTLLRLSPLPKETYENLQNAGSHGEFGISRQWMINAKKHWEQDFDW